AIGLGAVRSRDPPFQHRGRARRDRFHHRPRPSAMAARTVRRPHPRDIPRRLVGVDRAPDAAVLRGVRPGSCYHEAHRPRSDGAQAGPQGRELLDRSQGKIGDRALLQAILMEEFEKQAAQKRTGFLREIWTFLGQNKKWWLIPILTVLLLFG